MDPVTGALGAASLISGSSANKKAKSDARNADKRARALEKRATDLYDILFANAKAADERGDFDPERRIAAMERDTANYEAKDLGNLAGALATAGYTPGDSEIGVRLDSVKHKYRGFMDTMRDQIRQQAVLDKARAYSMADAGLLQPGIQGANRSSANAMGQMQSPGGFLQAFLPALQGQPKTPKPKVSLMNPNSFAAGFNFL